MPSEICTASGRNAVGNERSRQENDMYQQNQQRLQQQKYYIDWVGSHVTERSRVWEDAWKPERERKILCEAGGVD